MSFFARYLGSSGGGSGGVSSLNGLTGALTLVGGTGISVTPSGSNITIALTGGPFADVDLSNLVATAINQSLVPGVGGSIDIGSPSNTWLNGYITTMNELNAITNAADLSITTTALRLFGAGAAHANLSFYEDSGVNEVGFQAPATIPASILWRLPATDSTGTQALVSDGASVLSWASFFTLPALTAGSVLFSDGATIAEDNANFFWDDIGKTLMLGPPLGPPGTVPFTFTGDRTDTNPSAEAGTFYARHTTHTTVTNPALSTSALFESNGQVDAGQSTAATVAVLFQAYRNNGSPDAGAMSYLVGAFGGAHQIGTDPAASTDLIAGILAQVDVSSGSANKVADFYALSGSVGATITSQFGIYIEPPASGMKDNWLSGKALIGGSSYATHNAILQVAGDVVAQLTLVDSGGQAGEFQVSSNTTVDGSNTTIGITGTATALVQVGAENDKTLAGMNFAITRGDTTDQGILDAMNGANVLMFINSDTAGVTQKAYGFSTTTFSSSGTLTDLYDYYSERVPSGPGVITNHYGVYIKNDSTTPVKNWLSGITQMGGSSFSPAASTILDLQSTTGALLVPRMSGAQKTALTAAEGMIVYDTDDVAIEGYMGGVWTSLGGGGGGGANQHLSNLLSAVAINQDLSPGTGGALNIGTVTEFWQGAFIAELHDVGNPSGGISIDVNNRRLQDTAYLVAMSWDTRQLFDTTGGTPAVDWANRELFGASNNLVMNWNAYHLLDSGPAVSLNWDSRDLLDTGGVNSSFNWGSRQLFNSVAPGSVAIDFNTGVHIATTDVAAAAISDDITAKTGDNSTASDTVNTGNMNFSTGVIGGSGNSTTSGGIIIATGDNTSSGTTPSSGGINLMTGAVTPGGSRGDIDMAAANIIALPDNEFGVSAGGVIQLIAALGLQFQGSMTESVRMLTASGSASAATDYHLILNDTAPGSDTLTLPAGVNGLSYVIGFASTNLATWTAVGTGGDTVDANVTGNMASAVTVTVVFYNGTWYDA